MKHFLLFTLAAFTFFSCKNTPSTQTGQTTGKPTDSGISQEDRVAINDFIHNFYKWYEGSMETVSGFEYVKGGKSSTLVQEQLDAYYALLLKSGFISQEYIDDDRDFLKNLEATAWKNENVNEEPLTGLDYDRFFCAQDWEINYWTTSPVSAVDLSKDRVQATMTGTEGGSPREQKFELKKENGKWLIVKIICG